MIKQNNIQIDPMMDVHALAEYLGVAEGTILLWRKKGKAPRAYRLGRALRWRKSEVDAWLDAQMEPANG